MKRKSAAVLTLAVLLTAALLAVPAVMASTDSGGGFADVDPDAWYSEAVTWCADRGIMVGTSETQFSPDMELSRAMFATLLHRTEGTPAAEGDREFPDCVPGSWYSEAVRWAAGKGILAGYDTGLFGPEDPVTREMTAVILWRHAGEPEAEEAGFPDAGSVSSWAKQGMSWAAEKKILLPRDSGDMDPEVPATRAEAAYALMTAEQMPEENPGETGDSRVLVAFFSATGNTGGVAEKIARAAGADLLEIRPAQPYTSADLNYNNADSRTSREQNDPDARPEIAGPAAGLDRYDTVFLGYPIWFGRAPRIMLTFLESGDFSGKTVIPFCTSGSSGIGGSEAELKKAAPGADWREGKRFSAGATDEEAAAWVKEQNLETQKPEEEEVMKIKVTDGKHEAVFQLNSSSAAKSLYSQLPLSVKVENYSDDEKIFYPEKLDTSSTVDANAKKGTLAYFSPWGDVVMYYRDYGSYPGLYELGQAVSGADEIQNMSGTIQVTKAE